MREDEEYERAREEAEEAERTAGERARAEAERLKQDVLTGSMKLEVVRQQGLIYGGLILIGLYTWCSRSSRHHRSTSPPRSPSSRSRWRSRSLPRLVVVNRQEAFRGRLTPSVTVTVARVVAQGAAFVGIVAGFWHITWVAGVTFLAAGFVAVGIHSAGYMRLEGTQEPTS